MPIFCLALGSHSSYVCCLRRQTVVLNEIVFLMKAKMVAEYGEAVAASLTAQANEKEAERYVYQQLLEQSEV